MWILVSREWIAQRARALLAHTGMLCNFRTLLIFCPKTNRKTTDTDFRNSYFRKGDKLSRLNVIYTVIAKILNSVPRVYCVRHTAPSEFSVTSWLHGGFPSRWWTFVQLLFTTFLRGYLDSQVSQPINGSKRRFPNAPVSRISSLEPGLFTVDSSRRRSRAARARARAPRARGACNFSK